MAKKGKHPRKSSVHSPKKDLIKGPSISVCMIVKDEEQFLDNCLKSVKDVADEIIIIDTGSKDNTVDIAKKYTNKVYFHPWKDSFSEARNHYFKYAKGDWIFQIDADEELIEKDIPVLLKAVENTDIDAVMVQIVSIFRQGEDEGRHNVERLFRNNGIIHYEGRVHNRLVGFKRPQIYPIQLKHYGYDLKDKAKAELKHLRRIELLKRDIAEDTENPLPYHYLSCCYLPRGLLHETLEVGLKAIRLAQTTNNRNPVFLWTRYNTAMAYYKLKDLANAESMALSAIISDHRHLDSYYILTLVSFDRSKWSDVTSYGNEYLSLSDRIKKYPEDFGAIVANSLNESWNIQVLMGIALHELGRLKESEKSFQAAIDSAFNPFKALRAIGIYYYNKGMWSESSVHLEKALEINREDSTVKDLLNKIGHKGKANQRISCCMIVKNEEQFLEKCLSSIKDYVDEIIVVDTGSTDSTVEIARRFTDRVYFHPWENSFSKARNHALQYATGDWIFQIDADEELMAGNGEKLRQVVKDVKNEDIIYVKIFCSYSNGAKVSLHNFERLFRNNGVIHYEGSVHNRVKGGTKPFYSGLELWHYGYDVEEKKALEKFNRTTTLLKDEIEKDPDNPLHHHYLSASYASRGMSKEALDEAEISINLADAQNNRHPINSWTHFIASMSAYKLNSIEKAAMYATRALKKYPEHMDSFYMLSVIAGEKGDWDNALKNGERFLQLLKKHREEPEQTGLVLNNTMNEGPAINMIMGHAFHAAGSYERMNRYYADAYDSADDKWRVSWNIGIYHMDKSGDLNRAGYFLDMAVKEAPDDHDAWYMLAKLKNKCALNEEETECLEKVISIGTTDSFIFDRLLSLYINGSMPDKALNLINIYGSKINVTGPLLCRLAVSQLEKGQVEQAIKSYMTALERDAGLFEAWASLGELTLGMNKLDDSRTFFEKALSIKNDLGTILNLCDIASREGDIDSVVRYMDLLLQDLNLPNNITLNNFNELKATLDRISSRLKDNKHYQNQLNSISDRISPVS